MSYYLFGLQRSGTNIFECFVKDNLQIDLITEQKHYHVQKFTDNQNFQKYFGINNNGKIIVILKDIYAWLLSIQVWAIKKKWDKTDKMDFVDLYIDYYKKWYELQSQNKNILIIFYKDFLQYYNKPNSQFIKNIKLFFNKETCGTRKRRSVKCTGRWTHNENYYLKNKYMIKYKPEELKIIQQKLQGIAI